MGVAAAVQRSSRIAQHARYGWTAFYEHHVPTGDAALTIEQTILRRLRTARHRVHQTAVQLPNGWSETFDARHVAPTSLQEAIRREAAVLDMGRSEPLTLF
ncbi:MULTISPECIES: hypothetical protein [unclassified Streptomyces]|uniref:hypothetical protein n=1 Tax=unclassified Streptomyces TaxID=2593676 RepID=UPI0033B77F3A